MEPPKYLAEISPNCRLIIDELPPLATKVWLITKWYTGFAGTYHPEYDIVAWAPLPKLTKEQKDRIEAPQNDT